MTEWSLFVSKAKPFNITVIQVYAPTNNAEESEVEWVYENLQDLLELTPQKDILFIIRDWDAKVGSQEIPGVTGKFGLGVQNCTHLTRWMASLTQWTWVSVNSGSWWWTGRPGVLRFMGLKRVGHDLGTDLIWSDGYTHLCIHGPQWDTAMFIPLEVLLCILPVYTLHQR